MARLSDVLSRDPASTPEPVERFLHSTLTWGKYRSIDVGNVVRNFTCNACNDVRSFASNGRLSCLALGDERVSIDATLKCIGCTSIVELWFLITCTDSLYAATPKVRIERLVEHLRDTAYPIGIGPEEFAAALQRSRVAFAQGLGAGAMVYLRKIFEAITMQAATVSGIATTGANGGRKPFRNLLEEVNRQRQIIPRKFAEDGYRLYGELSDIVHGDVDEALALEKYESCRELVVSIVDEVARDNTLAQAIDNLGWNVNERAETTETL